PQAFWPPVDALREGAVDLALGLFAPEVRPRQDQLAQRLAGGRVVAGVRARRPGGGGRRGPPPLLRVPPLPVLHPNAGQTGVVDTALASRGLERRVALTVANMTPVPPIVAGSDLLGLAPERLARAWAKAFALRIFDLPIAIPDLPLTMVWHESRRNDPAQRWLRDRVAHELSDAPPARRRAS